MFAIQEALDDNGDWRPIEGRGFDFCGNGYWGLKIHSNEFMTILFPKYAGDFKTKIRVRIKNHDIIYVSRPFEGTINKKQFYFGKDRDYHYCEDDKNKTGAIQHVFYGSIPLELDDKSF